MTKFVLNNPEKATYLEVLQLIREYLRVATDDNRRMLWNVLTALRGPDNAFHSVKDASTAVIRHAVVGSGHPMRQWAICALDSEGARKLRGDRNGYANGFEPHFSDHAKRAFLALGLKWSEVNNIPVEGVLDGLAKKQVGFANFGGSQPVFGPDLIKSNIRLEGPKAKKAPARRKK